MHTLTNQSQKMYNLGAPKSNNEVDISQELIYWHNIYESKATNWCEKRSYVRHFARTYYQLPKHVQVPHVKTIQVGLRGSCQCETEKV